MKKNKILLLFSGFMILSNLFASFDIIHIPIQKITDPLTIQVNNSQSEISTITFFYKTDLDNDYKTFNFIEENTLNSLFTFSLDTVLEELSEEDFEILYYYFEIKSIEGDIVTYPAINPELSPVQVNFMKQNKQTLSNSPFVIISPDDLNSISNNQNIVISYFIDQGSIDQNTIKVVLDNQDITHRVDFYDGILVFFVPQNNSKRSLKITAKTTDGQVVSSPSWLFRSYQTPTIFERLDLYGNLTFINNTNNFDYKEDNTVSDNDQTGIFNLSFLYKKIAVKNYLYVTSLEDKNNQKINKYYLGFLSNNFDLHLGDYSPNYSEFTVNNKSIFGVSTSIKFNNFSLLISTGEVNRKISPNDSNIGSFTRMNVSSKIVFGNLNKTSLSFNLSKTKDKLGSLDEGDYFDNDNEVYTLHGKDNIVIGTDFNITDKTRRFNFYGEVAMSMYNSNINPGTLSKPELEDYIDSNIPFDPEDFESIIIINKNIEPFIVGLNNTALKLGLRANYYKNNVNIVLSQVGPSFYSLSTTGIVQDKRYIRLSDNIIITNTLFLSAGLELAQDNTVNQKDYTINSQSMFFSFNYQPMNYPYFNVNFSQMSNEDDLDLETNNISSYRTDFMNQYLSFTTGYSTNKLNFAYSSINLTYGTGVDKDNQENKLFDSNKKDIGLNTLFRFNEIPLTTKFGINYNMRKEISDESLTFSNFYINNEYSFLQNMLVPYIDYRVNYNTGGDNESNSHQINLGAKYKPLKNTSINVNFGYKQFTEENTINDNGYTYLFSKIVLSQTF